MNPWIIIRHCFTFMLEYVKAHYIDGYEAIGFAEHYNYSPWCQFSWHYPIISSSQNRSLIDVGKYKILPPTTERLPPIACITLVSNNK